jgi:mannose-6-phosphate isomerase-like protein (cupin superfamily)
MHEGYAFLFCVLAGTATMVTGGTLTRPRKVAPGETHGDAIEGGERRELKQGEIAHVPAGIPHQLLVAGEKSAACFVMKIQEA